MDSIFFSQEIWIEFFSSSFAFERGSRNWSFRPVVTAEGSDMPIKLAAFKGLNVCGLHKTLCLYCPKLFFENSNLEKDEFSVCH